MTFVSEPRNDISEPAIGSPLRIGVMVDGSDVAGWQYTILEGIVADPRFEIVAVIENAHRPERLARFRLNRDWSRLLWRQIDRVEARISQRRYASSWQDVSNYVDDVLAWRALDMDPQHLEIDPQRSPSGLVHRLAQTDLDRLAMLELDVIIRFGFKILKGNVLCAARFGIWSFHHADPDINRGTPPGFWEVAENQPFTGTVLQVLSEDLDNGVPLRKAMYVTKSASWNENRRRAYHKSIRLMLDALGELADTGHVTSSSDPRPFRLYDRALRVAPRPVDIARAAIRQVVSSVRSATLYKANVQRWQLLLLRGPFEGQSLRRAHRIVAPAGRYWADPFAITHDGTDQVFFEDFDLETGRGHIATARITDTGIAEVQPALQPDYHLSYPFVFHQSGELFMVPESYENSSIELWRCTNFPATWIKERELLSGVAAVDSTIVSHQGITYLFTNIDRSGLGEHGDELHIFIANDLVHGELQPHPANPVVTDVRYARMGGSFSRAADGTLVRPAQRGGATYGSGLNFMQVEHLSPTAYRERLVEEVSPSWAGGVIGVHHCSRLVHLTFMDACRSESTLPWRRRRART